MPAKNAVRNLTAPAGYELAVVDGRLALTRD
jgi:hypothetical protein